MAEGTEIGWCAIPGHVPTTLNPTMGCSRRSEGCGMIRWLGDRTGSCYAIHSVVRQRNLPGRAGLVTHRPDGVLDWTGQVALLPDRLRQPLTWTKRHAVFINALGEFVDGSVPDAYLAALWCVMWWTSHAVRDISAWNPGRVDGKFRPVHIYMLLTKLPARLRAFIRRWTDPKQRKAMVAEAYKRGWCDQEDLEYAHFMDPVLDNLWLGVSVENQEWADVRLPILAGIPAAVRFGSCEPLLGPLNVNPYLAAGTLDWVIVGGESDKDGKKARPMHPRWPRDILRQCEEHGKPFFFKQWGSFSPVRPTGDVDRTQYLVDDDGRFARSVDLVRPEPPADADAMTMELRAGHGTRARFMYLVGKRVAGEELDGQHHRAWPVTT